ncbi:MarR family winged helix-turn-helix transcriptional regulator [Myceligenerans salitolerans]|uniref:MarR family transcriptional regulator n=1 Tax=Myceligenerans salitolerans TaxID=1230528 RepID=A0ABS3IBM0_9MICO|nr:MarR family transcriptional regulator [Myceligenerans salitolerans]MBO0609838.1 MarR family transcriptional regulator [Myceligenerans salitolerans]
MVESGGASSRRLRVAHDFPYRSELLASLSALILLWESPGLQSEILTSSGEPIDQPAHQALRHLAAGQPMRPSDLAQAMGTGASNVSKIVKRLEAEGLVARDRDPGDTRSTLITLTPQGDSAARHIYDLGDEMIAQVLATWSPRDVSRFTELAKRFSADAIAAAEEMRRKGLKRPSGERPTFAD